MKLANLVAIMREKTSFVIVCRGMSTEHYELKKFRKNFKKVLDKSKTGHYNSAYQKTSGISFVSSDEQSHFTKVINS